jgi:ATP-dependent DNA helicase RecQ
MTPQQTLKKYWGHDSFREHQEKIINDLLEGKDVLAILPTGGGKSVCFQVPVLMKEGCCLVITPLIALMEDQVQQLEKKGISASAITAGMSNHETISCLNDCENEKIKFLYVSPERLETRTFLDAASTLPITLIAVDEAHCVSQWGYDFRPAYLNIAKIRSLFSNIPMIALTASATVFVKDDIIEKLKMPGCSFHMGSFSRPNLAYAVEESNDKTYRLIEVLKKVKGSSVVYCKSRKRTVEISELANKHGIISNFYHAGLDRETRKQRQLDWINGVTNVIVCTNAFGMGIDKGDVRIVIHADVPDCLENYYQEAGRAGRDGKKSYALLLYSNHELDELKKLPDIRFPNINTIRKVYQGLANYFQIPNNFGGDQYFDFDLDDFMKKFKLTSNEVIYSLQALKQERIISYQEQVYRPSYVQFICSRADLSEFEKNNPNSELITKALLRTYGGIIDIPVRINEKQISKVVKMDTVFVEKQLQLLHKAGIIKYIPKKESPQILYLQNRIKTDELNLNYPVYLKRKNQFTDRVNKMIRFAKGKNCRASYIATYFGDTSAEACGACDNCLDIKRQKLSITEFGSSQKEINNLLSQRNFKINELKEQLDLSIDIIMVVVEEMKKEGLVGVGMDGTLFLIKPIG